MKKSVIKLKDLSVDKIKRVWLWEYVPSRDGELTVCPINVKKTKKFSGRLVSSEVNFSDGTSAWALIDGIDMDVPLFSMHNRELILWIDSYGWFRLARYFDSAALVRDRGPLVLSKLIEKNESDIFPISFDIRSRSLIDSPCLVGEFHIKPDWGLTQAAIMKLLVDEL